MRRCKVVANNDNHRALRLPIERLSIHATPQLAVSTNLRARVADRNHVRPAQTLQAAALTTIDDGLSPSAPV
jgi:hypothetical protein